MQMSRWSLQATDIVCSLSIGKACRGEDPLDLMVYKFTSLHGTDWTFDERTNVDIELYNRLHLRFPLDY